MLRCASIGQSSDSPNCRGNKHAGAGGQSIHREIKGLCAPFASPQTVCHSDKEYARGNVHVNTAESSNALVKRGLIGIYHNVSKEHLHRYLWQFDFVWNHRQMNDGERTVATIKAAEG